MTQDGKLEVVKPIRQPASRPAATSKTSNRVKAGDGKLDSQKNAFDWSVQSGDEGKSQRSISTWLIRLFLQPDWLISFTVHLAVLLLFAWWILPQLPDKTIFVVAQQEQEPAFEIDEPFLVELEEPKLEMDDIQSDSELEASENELDLQLEESFSGQPDAIGFQGELVEHNAELFAENEGDGALGMSGEMSQQVIDIQEKVKKAGGKQGEVQFSLVWKNLSDIDLHVIVPHGERIYYSNKMSRCRGLLDVDRNVQGTDLTREPVENIRWLRGQAKEGRYTVYLHLFQFRERHPRIACELMAKLGDDTEVVDTQVSIADQIVVHRFIYLPGNIPESKRENRFNSYVELQENEEQQAQTILDTIQVNSANRDRRYRELINRYPHTDAALEALKRLARAGGK